MDQPHLYSRANELQRQAVETILNDFAPNFQLRSDGRDSLMDVGCGTGDVLLDFVRPLLPKTYKKIIGIDISAKMIEFSRRMYAHYDRVEFDVLDIETRTLPLKYQGKFDHVTSFFCLHWPQNQRQALRNIYKILNDSGDCFLVFLASHPLYDAFRSLASYSKWSEYLYDLETTTPPSQDIDDPWPVYSKLFKETGFSDQRVEIRQEMFIYEDSKSFKEHVLSVSIFIGRIPPGKRQEFVEEICEYWKERNLCEKNESGSDYRYFSPYYLVVAYAKK